MEYKKIENLKLQMKIKMALFGKKIDPSLAKMLSEVFLRRAYELELSPKQLDEELATFKSQIEEVSFKDGTEFSSATCMGVCSFKKKQIRINRDYYANQLCKGKDIAEITEAIYGTLAHEVHHACAEELTFEDKDEICGIALNEIVTETIANRITFSKDAYVAQHYRAETDGYGDITFAANIFAAAFGMTEKQFLMEANKGRKNLMEFVENVHNGGVRNFLAIEENLNSLYNLNYKAESFDYVQAMNLRKQMITQIYSYSIAVLTDRFAEEPFNGENQILETIAEYIYNKSKINVIMEDAIEKYIRLGLITPDSKMQILNEVSQRNYNLSERIYDADNVFRKQNAFQDKSSFEQAYQLAKRGEIRQYRHWYRTTVPEFGESLYSGPNLKDVTEQFTFESFIIQEDYDNGKQWNNEKLVSTNKKQIIQELLTKSLIAKRNPRDREGIAQLFEPTEELPVIANSIQSIKNFFYRIINKRQALPPGNAENSRMQAETARQEPIYQETENKLTQYRIEGKALYDPTLRNSRGVMKEIYRKKDKPDRNEGR